MTLSLNTRLLFAASVVLAGFLGLTGWVLDRAFRQSAETAVQDRLQAHMYALMAASDLQFDGSMHIPDNLPEARFSTPGSGLYAQVVAHDETERWRSLSSVGMDVPFPVGLPQGESLYVTITANGEIPIYTVNFGLAWHVKGKERTFTFSVGESLDSFHRQVGQFRRSLWGWLIGVAIVLVAVQGSILRWGLAPLRRVAEDLSAIEAGKATQLEGEYPKELRGLTGNLNALIRSERDHLNRYRNSLSDLAHSLKTPLAVLQGELEGGATGPRTQRILEEQLTRMRQIVDYQLQRAAASGRVTLTSPVSVVETATRIINSVAKVYRDKTVDCKVAIAPEALFYGDKGDLLEIFGNLIENAFKWCEGKVIVSADVRGSNQDGTRRALILTVDDDGLGIPEQRARDVLQRGARADEQVAGHGIGLAVVREIALAYDGRLDIGKSALGGARFTVRLPLRE